MRLAFALAIGTGLGTGYSPFASGTVGSVLGLALFIPIAHGGWKTGLVVIVGLLLVGTWAARECGALFGEHDHGRIVVDEVTGQLIALMTFPIRPFWLLAGFLVFRFFDIVKPFPARYVDRNWRSAAGVMTDDVIAGVYANLTLQALRLLWFPG